MIYEITKDTNYDQDMTPETLISSVEAMKQKGARFLTISVNDINDTDIELLYHFEHDYHVENLHMVVPKADPIQSITGVYLVAFIAENEAQDLFDVKFADLAVVYGVIVKISPSFGELIVIIGSAASF